MQNNLPDVIYAIPDCDQPVSEVWSKENVWTTSTTYIHQDSINVPDGLDDAINIVDNCNFNGHAENVALNKVIEAARELQRIKGLK